MKHFVLILVQICCFSIIGMSQPQIISPSFPATVDLFDKFEVSFTMGTTYSNPYDPDVISIYAEFFSPDNSSLYTVDAFYYEDYTFQKIVVGNDYYEDVLDSLNNVGWRIRFTPNCTGNWRFRIIAKDASGLSVQMPNNGFRFYSFSCSSVANADGFISMANIRYMKRDEVKNGNRQFHSFFPIGPDVAWYNCINYTFKQPRGVYFYEEYIDSLAGNANYMRIFINRYQYLSLYGLEFTQWEDGQPKIYFDSIVNQKDSAELDHIIEYAAQHGVSIMLSVFTSDDFQDTTPDPGNPSIWGNNPYHTVLKLQNPCEFFTDYDATRITKNLFRYIVSRWGYATNIVSWELWNEVDNMFGMCHGYKHIEQDVLDWHNTMAHYLRDIDPFDHCISTSMGRSQSYPYLYSVLYGDLDFVQRHYYLGIQTAESQHQLSYKMYVETILNHVLYPTKPFFFGEFGFGQSQPPYYEDKDPHGIDLHNSLWSSLFSTSMGPASFWFWPYLHSCGLFKRFKPLLNFCNNYLSILSETFTAHQTGNIVGHSLVFNNNIETFYMINATEDTIYGWSQDTAFAYQSLRWLTDDVDNVLTPWGYQLQFNDIVFDPLGYVYTLDQLKRPSPSFNNNAITLPISNQTVGSRYRVKWYNSETGYEYLTGAITYAYVQQDINGERFISINFPSYIRDLQQNTINNTFGDVVFCLVLSNLQSKKIE